MEFVCVTFGRSSLEIWLLSPARSFFRSLPTSRRKKFEDCLDSIYVNWAVDNQTFIAAGAGLTLFLCASGEFAFWFRQEGDDILVLDASDLPRLPH